MKSLLLLLFFNLVALISLFGQEVCNNGVDDDGDGFIDCFDSNCATNAACDGTFLGNDVICQAKPTIFPKFSMKLKWQSKNKTTNHLNRATIGDLNRDGIPEVITTEIENKNIYILNGTNGTVKTSLKTSHSLYREVEIANIDNSNCAWIFVSDGSDNIYAYDCNLNFKWKSPDLEYDPGLFGLADFDGDGKVEIYCRDEILAAESGVRIVKGTDSKNFAAGPIAVDILDAAFNVTPAGDNKLELISGCNIYSVNLGARTSNSGSLTLRKNVPTFFPWEKNNNGTSTSLADYNQDGFLDVIATGSTGKKNANATAFFWDVKNNVVKTYIDAIPGNVFIAGCSNSTDDYYATGWQNGMGRINIADIDGNGQLNASYISGKYLYALKEDFTLLWRKTVNEETSGYTGCTVYDFNGDGAAEVVYRDEQYLYIINGNDGSTNTQQQCIARTHKEYPIVADIDGDGTTELCVTCGTNDTNAWNNFCDIDYSENSCVRVFQSAGIPWVPARKLWNQHGYFNVNVNDDLTIPKVMQKQTAIFSSGVCTVSSNRPLNSFLNQSPFLDSKGCPTYSTPDLVNVPALFSVQPPVCPNKNFTVTIGVRNNGDVTCNTNVPVSFYNGNPTLAGATYLNTVNIPVNLTANQQATFTGLTVTGTGGPFTLFIALNDAGTTLPTPIKLPNTSILECNYDNVISASVVPKSVKVTAQKIVDNVKCIGATVPDNGAAKAFVTIGGSPNTVDFNFFWFNGPVGGAPSYTGASYTGLAAGTYSVFATHKTAGCNSDTATVTIVRMDKAPMNATILVDEPNTSCSAPNGKMHAVVNGGEPVNDFTYKWYEGNDIFTSPEVGVGVSASNLKGGQTYTVLVTDIASGCQAIASLSVPDDTTTPIVNTSVVNAICVPVNSGSASASVAGVKPHTFNWYNGSTTKPTPDFTGPAYNSLPPGSYTVTATENASGCVSAPVTVQVSLPPPFTVTASMLTQQTSCNPATPNGSATANVGGVTAGFTFNWFTGQSTAPANAIPGPTNLAAGVFTVRATNNATGCTATAEVTITQNLIYPVVTLTPAPNSVCDPTLGSSPFNGSVAATVTFNGSPVTVFTNYQFVWHNGPLATDPVIAGATTENLTNRNGGSYTLVLTRTDIGCAAPPATATVTNTIVLPVLTTSQTASTNCVPGLENGIAEVTQVNGIAVGSTTNFNYKWHTGIGTGAPIAGATNARLLNVQGGPTNNYTVLVTDKTGGCQNTATVLVADAKVLPALTLTKGDNSVCNPALTSPAVNFNGGITATVTNQVGALTNYSFAFGGGAGAGVQVPSPSHNLYTQLNGSATPYTVVATQTATGCVSPVSTIVVNNVVALPVVITAATGSQNCVVGKENGQARVTTVDGVAVGTAVGYTYAWTGPAAPPFPVTPGGNNANSATLVNLQGGTGYDYTVLVTHQTNGCQSTVSVNVPDNKALPVLTLTPQPNTVCDPTKTSPPVAFDGQVSALVNSAGNYVGNLPGDFTFTWNTGLTGVGQNVLLNKDVGNYSVTALHTVTGCQSAPTSAQVTSAKTLPGITMDQTPSTNCTGGTADGIARVIAVVPNGKNYDYRWFNGNSTSAPAGPTTLNTTLTTNNYTGVQGGVVGPSLIEYTVEVTILQSGCVNTATVGVADDKKVPVLGPLQKTDNTICAGTPDGTANINAGLATAVVYRGVNIPSPYAGFTFAWTGPAAFTATGTSISQRGAGVYSVTATNTASNCISNPITATINDDLFIPKIDVVDVVQTSCNVATPNGSLTATIDQSAIGLGSGITAGYSFTWVNNVTAASTPSNVITNQKGNQTYTITALRTATGCVNSQVVFLDEQLTFPTVALAVTNLTTCTPFNGKLVATPAPGPVGNYDYYWWDGSDAADEDAIVTNNNAGLVGLVSTNTYDRLVPQDYTVVVVDQVTQCKSSQTIETIADNSPQINPIAENTVVPASCNVAGGTLTGAVRSTPLTNFSASGATDQLTIGASIGLVIGQKVLISRQGTLALPAGLVEDQSYFVETLGGGGTIITLRDGGGVHINLTSNGDGTISDFQSAGFTFNWFESVPSGIDPTQSINYFTNPPNFAALVPSPANPNAVYAGINAGLYSLEVTHNASGCKNFISHTLPFLGSQAVIEISKTNTQVCAPLPDNGSITIEIEDPAAAPPGASYTVVLLEGGVPVAGPFAGRVQNTSYLLSNTLQPGTYVALVTQEYASLCPISQDVIIDNDAFAPVLTLTGPIIPNNACDPLAFNGRIDLNVSKDPLDVVVAPTTYDITMSPTQAPFPLLAQPVGNFSATNLGANDYSFTVTANTGCATTKNFTVQDNPVLSEITTANTVVTNAEYCLAALEQSASVVVNQVNLIGAGAEPMADYEFNWYPTGLAFTATAASDQLNVPGSGFAINNKVLLNLPASGTFPTGLSPGGEYFVRTAAGTVITLSKTMGGATVDVTANGSGIISINLLSALGINGAGEGGEVFSNNGTSPAPASPVTIGTYYVVATKRTDGPATGGIGCASAPLSVTIQDKTVNPVITLTPLGNTSCDPAFFEGSITVNASTASGPGAGMTYAYAWTPTGGGGQPVNSIGNSGIANVHNNVNDGTYSLTATNEETGCPSTLGTTLTRDTPPVFTMAASVTNQALCVPFDGKIDNIQVFVNGIGGVLTDFDYVWFRSDLLPGSIVLDGENVAVPVDDQLTPVTYPAIGLDKYFVKAIRKAGGAGVGCESAPLRKDILDDRVYPKVTFATVANSACDTNFDGRITVTATTASGPGAAANYNFVWTNDPDGLAGPAFTASNSPTNNTASPFSTVNTDLVGPGSYSIRVTNFATQCFSDETISVLSKTIPMSIVSMSSTNVDLCSSNNGSGTVISISETPGPGVLPNYTFTWANNPAMTAPFVTNNPAVTQNNLAVGAYFVTARKNTVASPATPGISGSGCVTAPATFNVLDKRITPLVSFTTIASTSCDNNFDGRITVTASTASGPGTGANYDFVWTSNPGGTVVVTNGINVASPYSTLVTDVVGQGNYTNRVTNRITQCFTDATVSVLSDPIPLQVLAASKVDQAICNPDGSITVTSMNSGTPANYTFAWFRTDPTSAALVDGSAALITGAVLQAGGGAGQYPTMGAGTFFVRGTKNPGVAPGSGCSTPPFEVQVNDVHVNPVIAGSTLNPDVNCAGGTGAGQITINEPAPLNFTFNWFAGTDITGPPVLTTGGTNGEVLLNLQEGDYTVQVRSNATNCTSVQRFTIANNPTVVAFNPTGFSAPAVTTCTLATGAPTNGSATVTDILENGAPQPLGNYTFVWTDAANTVLQIGASPVLNNIPPGSYFVKATNTLSSCIADLGFKVDDLTIGSTDVTLASFVQPERCVNPLTGSLTAQGGGSVAGPYSYEWYAGDQRPSPSGPTAGTSATLSNIPITPGQIFTIKVINSNNCWAVDAYAVPLITNEIVLAASSTPLTFCTSNNGEVYATIVNDNKFDYDYIWGIGNNVNPPSDFTTNNVPALAAGNYTVIAIDRVDPGCFSQKVTVTVQPNQIIPAVTVNILKDRTMCDPTKPDGVASADVAGDIIHYTFDWFTGPTTTGTPFYRGAEANTLTSTTYSVLGTDLRTGCAGSASVNIPFSPVAIPIPTVTVISHVTSCITDNGQLGVTVDGVTKDYIFDWRDGGNAPPPVDFTGEYYSDLSVGDYTVIATSIITGCVSPPATGSIFNHQILPEFTFIVQDATCANVVGNQPPPTEGTGYITMLVADTVSVERVEWYQGGVVSNGRILGGSLIQDGPNLTDAFAGFYQVNVTSTLGCQFAKEVELPVDIKPYNGISRRPESMNNFFLINCIDNFENNHVEIFNRAGTKVYEADRYDNSETLFDGKSNKGLSLMGTELPAGTYFYVIDKRNGSKKVVGYLELVD